MTEEKHAENDDQVVPGGASGSGPDDDDHAQAVNPAGGASGSNLATPDREEG